MPQSRLRGICNQCGLCCMVGENRCIYLEIVDTPGRPRATRCTVYDGREPGMAIILISPDNKAVAVASCAHGTPLDDEEIIAKGIGKGCSLELVSS